MKTCLTLLFICIMLAYTSNAQNYNSGYSYDANGNRNLRIAVPAPDLTPSQFFSASSIQQGQTIDMLVSIRNVGTGPTTGSITFSVTNYLASTGYSLAINTNSTIIFGGSTYTLNTSDFTVTTNSFAITLTSVTGSAGVIAAAGSKLLAFRLTRAAGSTNGSFSNTITIADGTGGGEIPTYNNSIANTIYGN